MKDAHDFFQRMRKDGHRLTKVRSAIGEIFLKTSSPLSAMDVQELLRKRSLNVNKTTVYRELLFLKNQNILAQIQFGDGKIRYEISQNHHHHLICVECDDVQDVILKNDLNAAESRIQKNNRFKILRHSLEFFGLCRNCSSL